MASEKKQFNYIWILIIIVAVLIIAVYLITFGQLDLSSGKANGLSFAEKKRLAENRNRKLLLLIEKKGIASKKFRVRFLVVYYSIAFCSLLLFGFLEFLLYRFLKHRNIGNVFEWTAALGGLFVAVNVIFFKKDITLKSIVLYAETRIQNWVYGRYIDIDKQIEGHKKEADELKQTILTLPEN